LNGIWNGQKITELDNEHIYNLVWYLIKNKGSETELNILLKENRRRRQRHTLESILKDDFKIGYKYVKAHNE